MPVYKKLYGVLPHGAPAGNVTLLVKKGKPLTDSSDLKISIVLISGSVIGPEFNLFFYTYRCVLS